jgi:hypothetical protein
MFPIFLGKVEKGKLILQEQDRFNAYLVSLGKQNVDIIVKTWRKPRSNQQNKWYWACVVGIPAEYYGYLPEEMHDAYKMMFLREHKKGKPETIRSTTTLSTIEFNEFTFKCQQWAAEQGLVIPNPCEVDF